MERSLLPVVVITDAQARRSGFLDNQPTQRLDFERLALARRVSAPLTGAGNCLKRPTDKLDGTLHAGAILIRLTPPRQFHQIGQPVQAGTMVSGSSAMIRQRSVAEKVSGSAKAGRLRYT